MTPIDAFADRAPALQPPRATQPPTTATIVNIRMVNLLVPVPAFRRTKTPSAAKGADFTLECVKRISRNWVILT
jgi:hypothetical protein